MGKTKLTARAVERLKIAAGKRQQDIKDQTPGLYLRLFASGKRSFIYRYKIAGRVRVLTLGDAQELLLADARLQAEEAAVKVKSGQDPGAEAQEEAAARRRMPTVEEFATEYIERHARPNKKTWPEDERMLARWVLPRIGHLKLASVHRRDLVAILDACRDAGNVRMPGKVLAVTRRMFRFGVERGVLEESPVVYITERQPKPARRAMTAADICRWWRGTDGTHPKVPKSVALALRLLLLTGQRPGEVAGLQLAELGDGEDGPVWWIPAERRKSLMGHAVALAPLAAAVVLEAKKHSDGIYLFPSSRGGPGRVDSGLNRGLRLIFGEVENRPTPHAARHTVATELEEIGLEESEIARVLGHQSTTVTGRVYVNRRSMTTQRSDLEAWERRLLDLVMRASEPNAVVDEM
jgi:integrase